MIDVYKRQSQMSSLSDANKSMEEAAKADNRTDAAETKKDQTQKATGISNAANRASATYTNNGTYSKTCLLYTSRCV